MTISMAEQIYQTDKELCEKRFRKSKKVKNIIGSIFGAILLFIGIFLLIRAANTPPTIDRFGKTWDNNTVEILFGYISMIWACGVLLFCWVVPLFSKVNYFSANKRLYLNYLRCTDMDDCEKEYYKEVLAELRNIELSNTIRRSATSTSVAIMFNSLHK